MSRRRGVCWYLKDLMRRHRISQEKLAEMIGTCVRSVFNKINGYKDWVVRECVIISRMFNKPMDVLFTDGYVHGSA